MFTFSDVLRAFLLRDCPTTYLEPAVLQDVNGCMENDGNTCKRPSNLAIKHSQVKWYSGGIHFFTAGWNIAGPELAGCKGLKSVEEAEVQNAVLDGEDVVPDRCGKELHAGATGDDCGAETCDAEGQLSVGEAELAGRPATGFWSTGSSGDTFAFALLNMLPPLGLPVEGSLLPV